MRGVKYDERKGGKGEAERIKRTEVMLLIREMTRDGGIIGMKKRGGL